MRQQFVVENHQVLLSILESSAWRLHEEQRQKLVRNAFAEVPLFDSGSVIDKCPLG